MLHYLDNLSENVPLLLLKMNSLKTLLFFNRMKALPSSENKGKIQDENALRSHLFIVPYQPIPPGPGGRQKRGMYI